MSHAIRRALGAAAASGLAIVGVQLVGVAAASAHTNTVSGTAACQSNGMYTVTWTVNNTYNLEDETATISQPTPSGSAISPTTLTLAKMGSSGDSGTVTQTGVPGSATSATIAVAGLWHPDNFTQNITGSTPLTGTCGGKPKVTATAPSAHNGACVHNTTTSPGITIPNPPGVNYRLNHKTVSAGTHTLAPGTYTVTASSTTKHLIGQKVWTFHLSSAPGTCSEKTATPTAPKVTQTQCTSSGPSTPTLTVRQTKGVSYTVAPSGPYRAGQTVTVTATTKSGYKFTNVPAAWTKSGTHKATYTTTFQKTPAACSGIQGNNATRGGSSTPINSPSGLASTGTRTETELIVGLGLLTLGFVFLFAGRRHENG